MFTKIISLHNEYPLPFAYKRSEIEIRKRNEYGCTERTDSFQDNTIMKKNYLDKIRRGLLLNFKEVSHQKAISMHMLMYCFNTYTLKWGFSLSVLTMNIFLRQFRRLIKQQEWDSDPEKDFIIVTTRSWKPGPSAPMLLLSSLFIPLK